MSATRNITVNVNNNLVTFKKSQFSYKNRKKQVKLMKNDIPIDFSYFKII